MNNNEIKNEIWESIIIEGFNNCYEISNFGRFRSLDRKAKGNFFPSKIYSQKINHGYYHVYLRKGKIRKAYKVHRLVALAFIPNPNDYPFVNHKNFNRQDNRVENLEWCTSKQNIQHSWRAGRMSHPPIMKGEKNPAAKLTEEKVKEIRNLYKTGNFTLKNLSSKFGVHFGIIGDIVNYKLWKNIC